MEQTSKRSNKHSKRNKRKKWLNLGPWKRSKVTRLIYLLHIVLVIFISMIILTPQIIGFLQRIFCHGFDHRFCDVFVGYDAVYRLGFALAIWFIILAFATLGITSSTEGRARVQNRCWSLKTVTLICLTLLFVLIPHTEYNGEIWLFFGLNAAFCFIILQYAFILDAANSFCILFDVIVQNRQGYFSYLAITMFRIAKGFTTVFLYSVSLISSAGFYFMYASYYECVDNFVFLTFHLLMCLASSVISLLPIVREASPQIGLFQCAVTSLYCTYIVWLSFSSEPQHKCNPSNLYNFPGSPMSNTQVWSTLFITFSTLFYISVRDLVTPQFGKVEKSDSSLNRSENTVNIEEVCNLNEDVGNKGSSRPEKCHSDNCDALKKRYDLEGDETSFTTGINDSLSPVNDPVPGDAVSLRPSSLDRSSDSVESENNSLAWDNTLFLPFSTNQTSAASNTLTNHSKVSSMKMKGKSTVTETKESLAPTTSKNEASSSTAEQTRGNITDATSRTKANSPGSVEHEGDEMPTKVDSLTWDDEIDGIEYSYPFFHLTFSLATLYLIMSVTNWYRLDEGEHFTVRLVQSWSTVWLRISASIFCSFILIWSMVIPLVFPDSYKDLLFFQYLTSLPR
ncbi:serine incorporator 1-like [Dendronephthya gigantea]|uniref:serine incorporator 1-like n=1 Tax=Dendronephthya gigantea TaxID=151771 RepID=UPI00106D3C96|nr:serine incorporator 1-like [Dendronephthya gigantea]